MPTIFERAAEVPIWKLAAGWFGAAALGAVGWYFIYFSDAVLDREEAEKSLNSAKSERQQMETKLANFEVEMEKAAQAQSEIDQSMEVLPQTAASVDHMMRTFQQQGRLVGLVFDKWSPGAEQKLDYYGKSTIAVEATGSWNQLGEFFRRIAEMRKIVSIENLAVALKSGRGKASETDSTPLLSIKFDASTYRFLSEEERATAKTQEKSSRRRVK